MGDASTRIWKYCKQLKVPANIADVPSECDFYFGSVHRDGPLQIMVSTNGNGPRMAAAIRRQTGQMLPKGTGDSIKRVGQLRRKLRMVAPGKGTRDISKRMGWMSEVCDKWSTDDFNDMNDDDMERLVQYYESGIVPSFEEIRLGDRGDVVWEFDFFWMDVIIRSTCQRSTCTVIMDHTAGSETLAVQSTLPRSRRDSVKSV